MSETKKVTLAKYLDCKIDDLEQSEYDENTFNHGVCEYLVLTDEEADERAEEDIKQSLWAFDANFIADHSKNGYSKELEESIKAIQEKQWESANPAVEAIIEDLADFVQSAISADGRGHFISNYDGEENQEGEYFIYRLN